MVPRFADKLALCIGDGADVVFNSCLCAHEFTGRLVAELEMLGLGSCRATGHLTAGHTTMNPNLAESTVALGTRRLVKPGTSMWKPWRLWLREGTNRFKAPWMEQRQIFDALGFHGAGMTTLHDGDPVLPPDWRSPANVKNQW